MKFEHLYIYKTALFIAVEKDNFEMTKLLLSRDNIDVNIKSVFKKSI